MQAHAVIGPAWVEIDLDAITHNTRQVLQLIGRAQLLAVVKADAYGHGAVAAAQAALRGGAHWLGVSTVPEALELREAGIRAPLLVLTPMLAHEAEVMVRWDLTATVVDLAAATALAQASRLASRSANVHIKVDTGMGRYGIAPAQATALALAIQDLAGVHLQGVFSHLAQADDRAAGQRQLDVFRTVDEDLRQAGVHPPLRHLANSAAVLTLPEAHLDMVRVGNLLYGMRPVAQGARLALQPAWRLKARVHQVHWLQPGQSIGYGAEYTARRPRRVAVLPVGYADGLTVEPEGRLLRAGVWLRQHLKRLAGRLAGHPWWGKFPLLRRFAGAGSCVRFAGRPAAVLGRVSMQQIAVDVTDLPDVMAGAEADLEARRTNVSPRLAKVYRVDGEVRYARTLLGPVELEPASAARALAAAAREESSSQ